MRVVAACLLSILVVPTVTDLVAVTSAEASPAHRAGGPSVTVLPEPWAAAVTHSTKPKTRRHRQPSPVEVFPEPRTTTVSPGSQLSFRGAGVSSIADLRVVGTASGRHSGHWLAHSDHGGASFVPDRPFVPGEAVRVSTSRAVAGVTHGSFTYRIAEVPAGAPSSPPPPVPSESAGSPAAGPAAVATAPGPASPYRSRPDLHPPLITTTGGTGAAPGLLFGTNIGTAGVQQGAIIYDNSGQPLWFNPTNTIPLDLHPVTYKGRTALAYFQAQGAPFPLDDVGVEVVLDTSYRQIGTIRAGNGYSINEHDVQISPDGTKALLTIYAPVEMDLSRYGGPQNGVVLEAVVQEVDIATGAVTFEWHSLGSGGSPPFPLTDTYEPLSSSPVDYFHLNSVEYDHDGNFLLTGRHVSVVAKLRRSDGAVLWRMGGKRNEFRFTDGDGGPSWPHDVRRRPDGTISVFDNGVSRKPPYSRGVAWTVDEAKRTAKVAVQWRHSPDLFGALVGSNRLLPNGDDLISWGNTGRVTEYSPAGQPVFESQLPASNFSYRVQRVDWHATPIRPPDMAVDRSPTTATAYASWNGATDVATWELWGGSDARHLRRLGSAPRSGFETTVSAPVQPTDGVFQTRALDGSGKTIGTSQTAPDAIEAKYASLGGSSSFLGSPVGGEQPTGLGLRQDYTKGSIYWSSATGAHEVHGEIGAHYAILAGPTSPLGFPTSDEATTSAGARQSNFQGGWIRWNTNATIQTG